MKHLFASLLAAVALVGTSAFALDINLSNAQLTEKSAQTLKFSNVIVGDLGSAVSAVFVWDANTSSLILKSISGNPNTPDSDLPVGQWNLNYDWGCSGRPLSTGITLNADHTFVTAETPPEPGKWDYNNDTAELHLAFNGGTSYLGTYDHKGTVTGKINGNGGCFSMSFSQSPKLNLQFIEKDSAGL